MGTSEGDRVLADVADLKGGFAFKSKDYADEGRFVLRTVNISDDGSITDAGATYIPEELAGQYARFELKPEDTLFVMVGATLGKVGFVKEKDLPALLNQNMWVIRSKDRQVTHPRFLNYWFREKVKETLGWASGSARGFVRRDDYRNLSFSPYEYSEQRAIAEILGSLDDKIELNRQMSRTLEAMTGAIFKAWFVDFEPVKAKAAGSKSFRGMPQPVFDQLPTRFTDTELGPVPEGWEKRPLAEVTNYLKRGISPKYVDNGGVRVINQRCVRDHWVDVTQSRRHDKSLKSVAGRELQRLDVLVNSTGVGTLGRVAQVLSLSEETVVDSHVTVVRANPEQILPECLGYDLSSREKEIEKLGHGSTGQTELSRIRLGELVIVKAPKDVQKAFARVIRPMNDMRVANWLESKALAALRDTLLPKLISGELRAPAPAAEGGADAR